jgi:hypothetical protein
MTARWPGQKYPSLGIDGSAWLLLMLLGIICVKYIIAFRDETWSKLFFVELGWRSRPRHIISDERIYHRYPGEPAEITIG